MATPQYPIPVSVDVQDAAARLELDEQADELEAAAVEWLAVHVYDEEPAHPIHAPRWSS